MGRCAYNDLSSCGLSQSVIDDKLVFKVQISSDSTEKPKTINIGDMVLKTANPEQSVTFECHYPMTVEAESSGFNVASVDADGIHKSDGTLDAGFELVLNNGLSKKIVLGQLLQVEAKWKLDFADVEYFYQSCRIESADEKKKVDLLKDSCKATGIGVEFGEDLNKFLFRTFQWSDEASSMDQVIHCTIKLCKNEAETSCALKEIQQAVCDNQKPFYWKPISEDST